MPRTVSAPRRREPGVGFSLGYSAGEADRGATRYGERAVSGFLGDERHAAMVTEFHEIRAGRLPRPDSVPRENLPYLIDRNRFDCRAPAAYGGGAENRIVDRFLGCLDHRFVERGELLGVSDFGSREARRIPGAAYSRGG